MPSEPLAKVKRQAEAMLAELDQIVGWMVDLLQDEFPSYRAVPAGELRPTVKRAVESALRALARHRLPSDEEVSEVVRGVETQARYGVSIEDVLRAFATGVRALWAAFRASPDNDLDAADELAAAEVLWAWDDLVTTQAIVVHRIVELDVVRSNEYRRLDFLNAVRSSADDVEIKAKAPVFGFSIDERYIPFRARPSGGGAHNELEREILSSVEGGPAISGIVEGDVAGVVSRRPRDPRTGGYVALGPPAPLAEMEPSFELAGRALETAVALGKQGTWGFEDLSIHSAVVADGRIGGLLIDRYVRPVERAGRRGARLLDTLIEYLRRDHDVEAVAKILSVHPNTVRYRLQRFEQLTGASLSRTEDLVGIWWALTRRDLAAEAPVAAGEGSPDTP